MRTIYTSFKTTTTDRERPISKVSMLWDTVSCTPHYCWPAVSANVNRLYRIYALSENVLKCKYALNCSFQGIEPLNSGRAINTNTSTAWIHKTMMTPPTVPRGLF
jgi:hypothetical protein